MLNPDTVVRLCAAFPVGIWPDVSAALIHVPPCDLAPTEANIGPVRIAGEDLQIPYRIYSAEPESGIRKGLSRQQGLILNALFTRHHDGHVRQKYVKLLLQAEELWLPPFVIQMLGEYVVEIVQVLELHLADISKEFYIQFLNGNQPFFSLLRSRLVSYWDCYYRLQFPRLEDYPAFRVAEYLEASRRHKFA